MLAAGGWSLIVGLIWLVNGLGTVLAVVGAAENTISKTFVWALWLIHPLLPWDMTLVVAAVFGLIHMGDFRRSPIAVLIKTILVGLVASWLLNRPINATTIGVVLGIIAHLTISKTEYLYWGAILSWRIIPLIVAIVTDVLTTAQGLTNLAYRMGWNWVLGYNQDALLPSNVLKWVGAIGTMLRRLLLASQGVTGDALPAIPEWTGRAVVVTVVITVIALGVERAFRRTWADATYVWSNRPKSFPI
jgi:hypothetical protein